MKKLLFILALTGVLFTGCHKDDDSGTLAPSAAIIGKWRAGSATIIYYVAGKEVYRTVSPESSGNEGYEEFRANNVWADFTRIDNAYVETDGTYTLLNNNTILRLSIQGQSYDYTVSFNNNNLITIGGTVSTPVTYEKNGTTYNADSETVASSLIRM